MVRDLASRPRGLLAFLGGPVPYGPRRAAERAGRTLGPSSRHQRWLHRVSHPVLTIQMLWGLHIQFLWPVTMVSTRRRQIIREERAQVTPRHLERRAELDRRRLGLPPDPDGRVGP